MFCSRTNVASLNSEQILTREMRSSNQDYNVVKYSAQHVHADLFLMVSRKCKITIVFR